MYNKLACPGLPGVVFTFVFTETPPSAKRWVDNEWIFFLRWTIHLSDDSKPKLWMLTIRKNCTALCDVSPHSAVSKTHLNKPQHFYSFTEFPKRSTGNKCMDYFFSILWDEMFLIFIFCRWKKAVPEACFHVTPRFPKVKLGARLKPCKITGFRPLYIQSMVQTMFLWDI